MKKRFHPKTLFLNFRMNLIRQILESEGGTKTNKIMPMNYTLRLKDRHFLSYNPSSVNVAHTMRRCRVCSKKNNEVRTSYRCNVCEVLKFIIRS